MLGADRWGLWEEDNASDGRRFCVRLCARGEEVSGRFACREEALAFQASRLRACVGWPRRPFDADEAGASSVVERDPLWDHPEELEPLKEYSFLLPPSARARQCADGGNSGGTFGGSGGGGKSGRSEGDGVNRALSMEQVDSFEVRGFLLGLPVLEPAELERACTDFDLLLNERTHRCPSDDAKFRAAHTLSRPLHQDLVARLAQHEQVLAIVEDILGPRFVCWSAHLFCKLPGDPTQQPWHQDAGFWPLSASRALTLWLALDDVDASNAGVTFVEGSHRLGRLPWQRTAATHCLLTQEIPDVDLLGRAVPSVLRAGEASVHCDLTVHGSAGNTSTRRRAGIALRFVATDADCLGPMINGYRMNGGCILPRGRASDPRGHWKALKRRGGDNTARAARKAAAVAAASGELQQAAAAAAAAA